MSSSVHAARRIVARALVGTRSDLQEQHGEISDEVRTTTAPYMKERRLDVRGEISVMVLYRVYLPQLLNRVYLPQLLNWNDQTLSLI